MASESRKVVYAALAGNVLVAASKFVAAAISGSSAMLTKAVLRETTCPSIRILDELGHTRDERFRSIER